MPGDLYLLSPNWVWIWMGTLPGRKSPDVLASFRAVVGRTGKVRGQFALHDLDALGEGWQGECGSRIKSAGVRSRGYDQVGVVLADAWHSLSDAPPLAHRNGEVGLDIIVDDIVRAIETVYRLPTGSVSATIVV